MNWNFLLFVSIIGYLFIKIGNADAINCFVCTSYNHDNAECEDPFYRSNNVNLRENCLTGIPNKNGSFRATHCLKLIAEGHGFHYVIRTCSVDSGSGRIDQEIVRVSHCGFLSLDNFFVSNAITKTISKINRSNSSSNKSNAIGREGIRATLGYRAKMFKGCLSVCSHDECNRANALWPQGAGVGYFLNCAITLAFATALTSVGFIIDLFC